MWRPAFGTDAFNLDDSDVHATVDVGFKVIPMPEIDCSFYVVSPHEKVLLFLVVHGRVNIT